MKPAIDRISSVLKELFHPPVMAITFDVLCTTAEAVLHNSSSGAGEFSSHRINPRQCALLATKASATLAVVEDLKRIVLERERLLTEEPERNSSRPPDWSPAATELHRVLKEAEILTKDCCCCEDEWLQVEVTRGNLNETFARLLFELEWHTWILCSLLDGSTEEASVMREQCEGDLRRTDRFLLSVAAKQDRQSLRALLTNSHDCRESKVCQPASGASSSEQTCLAAQLLAKMDAEDQELDRGDAVGLRRHFLWVAPEFFRKGPIIGKGSFAKVRETEWLGQKFAQKVFYNTSRDQDFQNEIAAVVGLRHPNVIRVVCCSRNARDMSIVMELMYMSLYDYLKGFTDSPFSILQAVDLMLQTAEGMKYLHGMNLVHRDLKSGNILVQFVDPEFQGNPVTDKTSLTVKIADFGLSKVKNDSTNRNNQTSDLGTTKWMAPETPNSRPFDEPPSNRFHPKKLDVYSFAIICYEILSGKEPFAGVPFAEVVPRVRAGLRPTLPDKIPGRLAALIQKCWSGGPQLRPEFAAICTELRFIKGLLLQGHNFEEDISLDFKLDFKSVKVLDLKSVQVQGPWGSSGKDGRMFFDGIFTFLKRIVLHFDKEPTNIWYMELEYDVNGTSFVVGHGKKEFGTVSATINIDGPSEYLAQIGGSFGTSINLPTCIVVQSLTFRTNKKTYGPFGREKEIGIEETKFKSDYGRIVGFFGRTHDWLDQIGCLIAPSIATNSTLQSITF